MKEINLHNSIVRQIMINWSEGTFTTDFELPKKSIDDPSVNYTVLCKGVTSISILCGTLSGDLDFVNTCNLIKDNKLLIELQSGSNISVECEMIDFFKVGQTS